ncbi:NAD(P)H-dependent oxidoreductase subunit E [bacterium AH-315-P15]|nr:NAD(P)H-dependent oxidoreductase subunit E [bacterium AH-315-P15]
MRQGASAIMEPETPDTRTICAGYGDRPDALLEILHDVQGAEGYIARDAILIVADALNLSRAEVFGVMSFYDDFRQEPAPKGMVKLCRAEACQAVGADKLARDLETRNIPTETVYCLGNCALGPAAMVEGRLLGRADRAKIEALVTAAKAGASANG